MANTRQDADRLLSDLDQANSAKDEFTQFAQDNPEKASSLISSSSPWSQWYEIPFERLIALFIAASGLKPKFEELAKSSDPDHAFLDYFDTNPDIPDEEKLTDEDKTFFASLLIAISNQIKAISMYNMDMHSMIQRVNNGNDKFLFRAILVDRTVISIPSIATRIQKAQLIDDKSFFKKLSNAIAHKKPKRPAEVYDNLRYINKAMEENSSFMSLSREEIYDLMIEDLKLYPSNSKDPYGSFHRLRQRIKKAACDI